jgi:hypothetical protein
MLTRVFIATEKYPQMLTPLGSRALEDLGPGALPQIGVTKSGVMCTTLDTYFHKRGALSVPSSIAQTQQLIFSI